LSILFIDTETTGKAFFDLPSDDDRQPRMVQLAAVLSDPTGRVRGQLDVLILPEGWSVPVDATRVHGLTTDDCTAHGVRASSALKLLCEMAGDASKIVAHNIDFDAFILDGEFRRAGIQDVLPTEKYFCTMKAATDVCRLPGRRGFKWPLDLTRYQLAAAYDAVPAKAPSEGERTGVQSGVYGYAPFGGVGGWGPNLPATPAGAFPWPRYPARGGVAGGFPFNPFGQTQGGYDSAPPPTYDLYRTMDGHPTLALARGVVMSPILAASWSYESKKGTPDDRVDFVRETFDGLRAFVLSQMSRGLSFGHRGFELVYEQRAFSNRTLLTVRKFKPLRPEKTTIVADQQTGAFQGFKQPGVRDSPKWCCRSKRRSSTPTTRRTTTTGAAAGTKTSASTRGGPGSERPSAATSWTRRSAASSRS
jgi:DNA polymerase-3 subunit epsilon